MTNDIPRPRDAVGESAPGAKYGEESTDTVLPKEAAAIETLEELRKRGRECRRRWLNS